MQITREERFFCCRLYTALEPKIKLFLRYLVHCKDLKADFDEAENEWELGYEFAFYRDLLYKHGIKEDSFSQKRTFDFCLLSENRIIIIEAKAQQRFESKEIEGFKKDRDEEVKKLLRILGKENIKVNLVGICSSKFKSSSSDSFESILTWKELYYLLHDESFLIADNLFNN
jgi:hypothetical protein